MARNTGSPRPRTHSAILLTLTSIYGLLYVAFLASGSYGTAGSGPTVVRLLFVLFLIGYVVVWLNEGLGGAIFVAWWIGMWYVGVFVAQHDRGAGVVMGLPLFILALLFVKAWHKRSRLGAPSP